MSIETTKSKSSLYYLMLFLLTAGASLILGFLSFSGFFVLWPILSLAFAAFVLSVAYEGEIYWQNIKNAFEVLSELQYLQRSLATKFLAELFPDTSADDCPQFFKDYEQLLRSENEKELRKLERWFAARLFHPEKYEMDAKLKAWFAKHQDKVRLIRQEYQQKAGWFRAAKIFSGLSAIFMGLSTTYLLVEAFSAIPFFAAMSFAMWPVFIIPMAIIAGAAYGFLTFNSLNNMLMQGTLGKWWQKIKVYFTNGWDLKNILLGLTAIFLFTLALALTICTAGTWWTIVQQTRPLIGWIARLPSFLMTIINPIVLGLSSIVFNIQNSSESLELIEEQVEHGVSFDFSFKAWFADLRSRESWWQIINPFRLLLKLTLTPLRIILFIGHLLSIALTAGRMPGLSAFISGILALVSEGFEDLHYFSKHAHSHENNDKDVKELLNDRLESGHGHSHSLDLPTRILKLIFSPIYFLTAGWDWLASKSGPKPLSFTEAWHKQQGTLCESSTPEEAKAEVEHIHHNDEVECNVSHSSGTYKFFKDAYDMDETIDNAAEVVCKIL